MSYIDLISVPFFSWLNVLLADFAHLCLHSSCQGRKNFFLTAWLGHWYHFKLKGDFRIKVEKFLFVSRWGSCKKQRYNYGEIQYLSLKT